MGASRSREAKKSANKQDMRKTLYPKIILDIRDILREIVKNFIVEDIQYKNNLSTQRSALADFFNLLDILKPFWSQF
jgi:hypothetical protein